MVEVKFPNLHSPLSHPPQGIHPLKDLPQGLVYHTEVTKALKIFSTLEYVISASQSILLI